MGSSLNWTTPSVDPLAQHVAGHLRQGQTPELSQSAVVSLCICPLCVILHPKAECSHGEGIENPGMDPVDVGIYGSWLTTEQTEMGRKPWMWGGVGG